MACVHTSKALCRDCKRLTKPYRRPTPPYVDLGDELQPLGAIDLAFGHFSRIREGDTVSYLKNGEPIKGVCTCVKSDRAWVMPDSEYWGPDQGPIKDRFHLMRDLGHL
jgi:hypothetical protein